ncbi:MAG: KH domain-containing protein [Kiritimatiellae bacterium]|nr:KH domain-containing protein [Kiritimatiellia bacterium]
MKSFVEYIVQALVDRPKDVRVTGIDGDRTAIFELRCNPQDLGKVIGKRGQAVSAIRTLLNTMAAKQGRKAMLEIVE